ncbi:hypothetical protein V1503_24080 [Bacillus sp. SCS-151]|uniref:hypothetical protein n=1 Tax=Nanhaiella sioensis TaxID=3115293 RepID=UPI003978DCEB
MKSNVIPFPPSGQYKASVYTLFPKEVADSYVEYCRLGVDWSNTVKQQTIYEGFPFEPPCDPILDEMIWYASEMKRFGVWVINKSHEEIRQIDDVIFGWSPFVRKSTAPPIQPVHIQSVEVRKQLTWYVDEDGYGQYCIVRKDGTIWIPYEKPDAWDPHPTK